MKTLKIIILSATAALTCSVSAQTDCGDDRYVNRNYFSAVQNTMNVEYGSNRAVATATTEILKMDIYMPEGDSLAARPLIIFAHGGSFVGGSRSECATLCVTFAKMGYVAATIGYRTGLFVPNEVTTTLAVMRAMHDMKAAIRFFRKDAAAASIYGIDTSRIIIGGISAGAVTAIHAAYLDEDSEIPAYLANDTAGLGGIEGKSGNPGYSSKAFAVVNFAGAIGDTSWINAGDAPITSYHYSGDPTVPYDTREVRVNGYPTGLTASGSGDMSIRLNHVGVPNELMTFAGNGHVDYLNGPDYDTVINSAARFLYNNVVCKQSTAAATPAARQPDIEVFPNPSDGRFVVRLGQIQPSEVEISVCNAMGKLIRSATLFDKEAHLDLGYLSKGLYIICVKGHGKEAIASRQLIVAE